MCRARVNLLSAKLSPARVGGPNRQWRTAGRSLDAIGRAFCEELKLFRKLLRLIGRRREEPLAASVDPKLVAMFGVDRRESPAAASTSIDPEVAAILAGMAAQFRVDGAVVTGDVAVVAACIRFHAATRDTDRAEDTLAACRNAQGRAANNLMGAMRCLQALSAQKLTGGDDRKE